MSSNDDQQINKEKKSQFRDKLMYLYKQIDKASNLLWSHDNHITGTRKRNSKEKDDSLNWLNFETTQTGYGEISMGAMTNLFNLFQNVSDLIEHNINCDSSLRKKLKYSPNEYNMNDASFFLDIGSGFGKPVYHSSFQTGSYSVGIEVVPARVEFCLDFYYEYLDGKDFFSNKKEVHPPQYFTKAKIDLNTITMNYYCDIMYNDDENNKFQLKKYNECAYDSHLCYDEDYIQYCKTYESKIGGILIDEDAFLEYDTPFQIGKISNIKESKKKFEEIATSLTNNIYKEYSHSDYHSIQMDNVYLFDCLLYFNILFKPVKRPLEEIIFKEELNSFLLTQEQKYVNINTQSDDEILKGTLEKFTSAEFNPLFYTKVSFLCKDATKSQSFKFNNTKNHFTHIYSYNKLFSETCRTKVSKVLNKTNWKILAWYTNPHQTMKSGLKKCHCIGKFPMNSTGTQKFNVYIYIKLK